MLPGEFLVCVRWSGPLFRYWFHFRHFLLVRSEHDAAHVPHLFARNATRRKNPVRRLQWLQLPARLPVYNAEYKILTFDVETSNYLTFPSALGVILQTLKPCNLEISDRISAYSKPKLK